MHGEHHAELFELSPERIELGQRGIAPVPEAGPDGRGLEATLGHPPQLGDRLLDALDGEDGAGEEPPPVGPAVVVDPVVVGAGQRAGRLGVLDEGQSDEPGREEHHLIGAERVHVAKPGVGLAAPGQAPEFPLPFLRAGNQRPHLLLAPAWPAHLRGVGPLARGGDHPAIDVKHVRVRVEVELRLHARPDGAGHVLVPDLGRLDDMAVTVEDRKVLGHHGRPPWSLAASKRVDRVSLR